MTEISPHLRVKQNVFFTAITGKLHPSDRQKVAALATGLGISACGGCLADLSAQMIESGEINWFRNFTFTVLNTVNGLGLHYFYQHVIERIQNDSLAGKVLRPFADFALYAPMATALFFVGSGIIDQELTSDVLFSLETLKTAATSFAVRLPFWGLVLGYMYNFAPKKAWFPISNTAGIIWASFMSYITHY